MWISTDFESLVVMHVCLAILIPPPGLETHSQQRVAYKSPAKICRDRERMDWHIRKLSDPVLALGTIGPVAVPSDDQCSNSDSSNSVESASSDSASSNCGYAGDDEKGPFALPTVGGPCRPQNADLVATVMTRIVTLTLQSNTSFGNFAKAFLRGSLKEHKGRIRNIYPLPWLTSVRELLDPNQQRCVSDTVLIDFANLTLAGLSFLHGASGYAADRAPTALQRPVLRRIVCKVQMFCLQLAQHGP